jgi:hypothetical protein
LAACLLLSIWVVIKSIRAVGYALTLAQTISFDAFKALEYSVAPGAGIRALKTGILFFDYFSVLSNFTFDNALFIIKNKTFIANSALLESTSRAMSWAW